MAVSYTHLKAFTEHTVTDKLELKKEIAQFRNQGYAVDNQEIEQGLWCMAVPIYDNTGHMKAAISVSGLKQRMVEKKELLKTEMLKAARDLSRDLGYYKAVSYTHLDVYKRQVDIGYWCWNVTNQVQSAERFPSERLYLMAHQR